MVYLQHIAFPLFYNSDKDKEFSFNFGQWREAFINTDRRRFKIRTSDMRHPPFPPPPPAGPLCNISRALSNNEMKEAQ